MQWAHLIGICGGLLFLILADDLKSPDRDE